MADSAGIIFNIKADSSQASTEMKAFKKELDGIEKSTKEGGTALERIAASSGLTAQQFSSLKTAVLGTTAVIGGIVVAGTAVVSTLFQLAKGASEYGGAIFNASEKTGASTDSLQALKFAAEESGSSFESVTNAVSKFNVLIGNATAGNEKAQKALADYGVTSRDTDTALVQAISTIAKMTDQTDQAAAASRLFKDRTGEILPVIKSFNGDLPGLVDKLRDLGLLMSRENTEAADKFGDQMDTLNKQFNAVKITIGAELMPVFNQAADDMSAWLATNQGEVQAWGQTFSSVLSKVAADIKKELNDINELDAFLSQAAKNIAEGRLFQWDEYYAGLAARKDQADVANETGGFNREKARYEREMDRYRREMARLERLTKGIPATDSDDPTKPAKVKITNIDRADRQDEVNDAYIKNLKETMEQATDLWDAHAKETLAFQKAELATGSILEAEYAKARIDYDDQVLARKIANLQKEVKERERLGMSTVAATNQINILLARQGEVFETRRAEAADKEFKKKQERWAIEAQHDADKAVADQAAWEAAQERASHSVTDFTKPLPGLTNPNAEEEADPFYLWKESWKDFFSTVEQDAPVLGALFEDLGSIMQGAFEGLAQSIGAVVQQWVLYGNTGPAVMRKMLAAVLASVAAEAAVKAIMATAEGFYFLATGNYAAAANAFTAAAFYGAVAGVAALAGRAIAGDSFKQQTGRATGSQRQGSSGGSGSQGSAYSSQKDGVREAGRNETALTLNIVAKEGGFADMFAIEVNKSGRLRETLRTVASES